MDMAMKVPESVSIQRLVMDGRAAKGASSSVSSYDSPARGRGNVQSKYHGDVVDVSGLEAIGEAIRQFRGQEALPIPESVGKAIRSLVQDVLNGLPQGGVIAYR